MNKRLLVSSIVHGGVHLGMMYMYTPHNVYCLYVVCGIATSMWNHGGRSEIARWTDRIVMIFAVLLHLVYFGNRYLTTCIVSTFLFSKLQKDPVWRDVLHIATHSCATISNFHVFSS